MNIPTRPAIPGGISSLARDLGLLDGAEFRVASSAGSRLVDVGGKSFVDYGMAMGANLIGHAHPTVVAACIEALQTGPMPGFLNIWEEQAAATLAGLGRRTSAATFTTTGTEAVHLALRIARGRTGRRLVAKTVGGYDGWFEDIRFGLVQTPEAQRTNARPVKSDVTLLRVNDTDDLTQLFADYGDQLAAIVIEPLLGNTGCLALEPDWVAALNALAAKHGVMIVSDEVMAGLRQGVGLVADVIGLNADLVTMGKAIGSGVPVAAVLGTEDAFAPIRDNSVARFGTYHGNPLVCRALLATFDVLAAADYQAGLYAYGAAMRAAMVAAFAAEGIAASTVGFDSVFSLWFRDTPPKTYDDSLAALNPEATRLTYAALRRNGVISLPSPWGRYFVSFAHGPEDLEITRAAFAAAARDVAAAGCVG